jgi:hypothetical protein
MTEATHVVCTVSVCMVLEVRIVVDSNLAISLTLQELSNYCGCLLKVALAIRRRMISTREPGLNLRSVWLMVCPATWPTSIGREVACGGVPVKSMQ